MRKVMRRHLGLNAGDHRKFFVDPDDRAVLLLKRSAALLCSIVSVKQNRRDSVKAQLLLAVVKEVVPPIDDCAQGLVARQPVAVTTRQDAEAFVKAIARLLWAARCRRPVRAGGLIKERTVAGMKAAGSAVRISAGRWRWRVPGWPRLVRCSPPASRRSRLRASCEWPARRSNGRSISKGGREVANRKVR